MVRAVSSKRLSCSTPSEQKHLRYAQNNHRLGRPITNQRTHEHHILQHLNARGGVSDRSQTRYSKIERLRFALLPKKQCLNEICKVLFAQALVSELLQKNEPDSDGPYKPLVFEQIICCNNSENDKVLTSDPPFARKSVTKRHLSWYSSKSRLSIRVLASAIKLRADSLICVNDLPSFVPAQIA